MLIIKRESTDPYINLATEEFVLHNIPHDSFMLWQNEKSIIVGKHQNTYAEINLDYVNKNSIPIVRRISGGGTVFHDLGNLNFTFISSGKEGKLVDFRKYTKPIIDVLKILGIEAKFEGKNNLTINGLKISGNAEHVFKKKVLHHGTLLFSSTLDELDEAIKVKEGRYFDKAVKSIRSKVTNISQYLIKPISIEQFKDMIYDYILETNPESHYYNLSAEDHRKIEELVRTKYASREWNYGYSPKYQFQNKGQIGCEDVIVHIQVENGIIQEIKMKGSFFKEKEESVLEDLLIGIQHNKSIIKDTLIDSGLMKAREINLFIALLF